MKLLHLINCDIYRDGGSFDSTCQTDEHKEWAITLKIWGDWMNQNLPRQYRLFNCRINDCQQHRSIEKESPEHKRIVEMIHDWMTDNNINREDLKQGIRMESRLYDLLMKLEAGDY